MLKELLSAIKLAATEKIQMISQRGVCAAGPFFVKVVFCSYYLSTFCILSAICTCWYCDLPAMISMRAGRCGAVLWPNQHRSEASCRMNEFIPAMSVRGGLGVLTSFIFTNVKPSKDEILSPLLSPSDDFSPSLADNTIFGFCWGFWVSWSWYRLASCQIISTARVK